MRERRFGADVRDATQTGRIQMKIIAWWKDLLEQSREWERQEARDNDPEYDRLTRENAELRSRNMELEHQLGRRRDIPSHYVAYQELIDSQQEG